MPLIESVPDKPSILIQLDTDRHPSVFDRVVAADTGVDHVFSYGGVAPDDVEALVHGAIFTRSPRSSKRTAVFVGGSDVAAGEAVLKEVVRTTTQVGLSVSAMLDSNGANTTASAAVLAAAKHLELGMTKALVLGGTGPVGLRVALLLARQGADVRIGSRSPERAGAACVSVRGRVPDALVEAVSTASSSDGPKALAGRELVVSAGAAGAVLLPEKIRKQADALRVAIDLNAVPPVGVEGVDVFDKAAEREGVVCYGALGTGEAKMKIHRAALAELFTRNDLVLDAEAVYDIGGRVGE